MIRRAARWLVVWGLLVAALDATAAVKPKILIIFDTSGSMLEGGADGSPLCSNQNQSCRLYELKQALFEVLQGMGAEEVDFGLQTFPQMVGPTRTPICCTTCIDSTTGYACSGHYYMATSQNSEISGESYKHGCKVSTHTPSTQQNASCGLTTNPCSAWYNNYKLEALRVPVVGSTPEAVMIYFDQKEDTGPVTALTNPEARAASSWYTPLGKSLFYAHGYYHKEVVPSILAYEKPCTKLVVALFTDGDETCNDGTTSDPFYPTKWSKNLYDNLGVVTHTVAVDYTSSFLQSIAQNGHGNYYLVQTGTNSVKLAFLDIIAKALPPSESCNGKDDDCDNLIDEDFAKGQACDNGQLGLCYKAGTYVCKTDGSGVVCNAAKVTPGTEVCNGIDDDCDGAVDEAPLVCPAPCLAQPEICNNKDDDCDKLVDEGYVSTTCGKNIGECKPGATECKVGVINCIGGTGPVTEVCDGKDNDCDGTRDGMTESCYTFSSGCTKSTTTGAYVCKGSCRPGTKTCTATLSGTTWTGVWGSCIGAQGPGTEVCDGIDNDCDGIVDNKAECPTPGSSCIEGQCSQPCSGAEFSCPKGQLCKNGWCVKDPCDIATCTAKGWVCRGGACVDPCQSITCGKYEVCVKGTCVDTSCYSPAHKCPAGQTCVQGKCAPDPCAKVSCGPDEFCSQGSCVRLCETMKCPEGESCQVVQEGGKPVAKCVEDSCAGKQCGTGFTCIKGKCEVDPCNTVKCNKGEVCVLGKCVKDPCEGVTCPTSFVCKQGMCVNQDVTSTTELLATGAGGCACRVGGSPDPALFLLGLGALLLRRRRRSR